MLQIKNVTKRFGGVLAVDNCSFNVAKNKITALVGPNGAGKTTLFDIISGLIKSDEGSIIFRTEALNKKITDMPTHQIMNLGVSRIFQQVRLFRYLSILDHLLISENNDDTKLWRNVILSKALKENQPKKRQAYINSFGIDRDINTDVSDLSYGQRKLLQLAMALNREHVLLLLDEPVAGVNTVVQKSIEKLILGLKEKGETVVMVEHDMEFVRKIADHVIVMDAGRVLVQGPPQEVLNDPKVLEAYLGE